MKLPSEFEARTLEWMGEETYRALEAALQTEPPVSIRVNRTKWSGEVAGEPVLWASAGIYLSQRPTFTFDPLFHAGCYYVQEASSMFVEQVLRTYITGPVVMLDLCAAPGGKTVVPEWRRDVDLVGISHCGVSQCAVNIVFLGKNLP